MGSHDTAKVISVIETTLTQRGNGKTTPIRTVTQYWSMKGELLAEVDPLPDMPNDFIVTRDGAGTPIQLIFEDAFFVRQRGQDA